MTTYSNDFKFFLENQIGVACTNEGKHITFFSRLNGDLFQKIDGIKKLTNEEINKECYSIYIKIKHHD